MSMVRRSTDTLQKVMNAFKLFEKKFDKLQDDVHYQGQTLTDLRVMVANLTGSYDPKFHVDTKQDVIKPSRKSTAVQYDEFNHNFVLDVPTGRVKRRNAIQSFQSKIKAKSFQSQKLGMKLYESDPVTLRKMPSSPKGTKHMLKPTRVQSPRKVTTIRKQSSKPEKKRVKINKI